MPTPALPMTPALAQRLMGSPLILLLDVDGTLSPIARRPGAAVIPPETRRVLGELVALPDVHVGVISGRGAEDAARLVSVRGTWTIGNHGFEVADPSGVISPQDDVERFRDRIAEAGAQVREIAKAFPDVLVEDKRWTLSVHYRLVDRDIVPMLLARVEAVADDFGLRTTRGKEVIELRPPMNVNKGTAALDLAQKLGALRSGASLLVAGDDRTDEDAFIAARKARPDFVTVRVAEGSDVASDTAAEFSAPDTEAFRRFLEELLERRRPVEARAS